MVAVPLPKELPNPTPLAWWGASPFVADRKFDSSKDQFVPTNDLVGDALELINRGFAQVDAERYGEARTTLVNALDSSIKTVSPAVLAYQMDYEPALFIADAAGKVVERLDAVWDADELNTALQLVTN